jgi:hypothetical protein
MKILPLTLTFLLAAGLLSACAAPVSPTPPGATPAPATSTTAPYPAASPTAQLPIRPTQAAYPPAQPTPADVPPAVQLAIKFFAQKQNATPGQVTLVAFDQMDFSDACLGAPVRGEVCAQVITPGYIITIQFLGKSYELHTDLNGSGTRILSLP